MGMYKTGNQYTAPSYAGSTNDDYTLTEMDHYALIDNSTATKNITITLPPTNQGLRFTIASAVVGKTIAIKCVGADVIKFAGLTSVTTTTSSATNFSCVTLVCISPGVWTATDLVGAFT